MAEHDLEKLLGGFAADTLTPEEQKQLFTAALKDQQLFNALADEQALKEMLADPAVRRRLLQSLAQPRSAGSWRSWMDRLTKPAGLAWAGGVAVGVFAVVLGLRIYQDSLRQASDSTALEEEKPSTPSTAAPAPAPLNETEVKDSKPASTPQPAAKDPVSSASSTREKAATAQPQQGPRSRPEVPEKREPPRHKESQKLNAPIGALGKSADKPVPAAPASGLDVEILAAQAPGSTSARALFHGQSPAPEVTLRAQEKEAKSAPKIDRFALARNPDQRPVKPLALRYSFLVEGEAEGTVTLTVESNQDAYLQIWRRAGDTLPELVLPAKETGRISLRTAEGQRQRMTVPPESDRLIVRLSRVPFGPITRQEAVMAGRGLPAQLTEPASGTEEEATYVANPDLSAAELAIDIPLGTNAPR